jgi:hypothetical protein
MSRKKRNTVKWQKPGGPPGGMQPRSNLSEAAETQLRAVQPGIAADMQGSQDKLDQAGDAQLLTLARELTSLEEIRPMETPGSAASSSSDQAAIPATIPESASKSDLVSAIRELQRAKNSSLDAARKHEHQSATLQVELEGISRKAAALSSREEAIEAVEKAAADRSAAVEGRHLDLLTLQAQADAGFPDRFAQWRSAEERQIADKRTVLEAERESLAADRRSLDEAVSQLKASQRELGKERAKFDAESELFDDRLAMERERIEAKAEERHSILHASLATKDTQIKRLEEQLKRARGEADELKRSIEQAGGLSIADLTKSLAQLRSEVDRLELELARNPGHESIAEYKKEAERARALDGEILRLQSQLHQKATELDRMRIPVAELENSRVLVQNMQLQYKQLKEANEALQADVESKLTAASDRQTFPEMSRMDRDSDLQASVQTANSGIDLKWIVDFARTKMANRPTPLYYDLETIRCFLGGLSMSRLHILQGISGTGKTSLPVAFADALSGRSDKIAVQAGWRDRQDLLGYYNAFDKRYHETDFVKALYRAQCPQWSDRLCLIILDEMNLSYIEQFGADLLAELESPHPGGPQLSLMEYVPPQPAALLRGGKAIEIPENVWFIGTANRDETTKDFADKSYDRAHTMELPRHQTKATLKNLATGAPVSVETLAELFGLAKTKHKAPADTAVLFVDSLGDMLRDGFDIGWGNRLERQIRDFAPVIVAAGGSIAEAVDHIVSTKLLRKLEHRHHVRAADLKRLRKALSEKSSSQLGAQLAKCDSKLAGLIRERSSDEGGAS